MSVIKDTHTRTRHVSLPGSASSRLPAAGSGRGKVFPCSTQALSCLPKPPQRRGTPRVMARLPCRLGEVLPDLFQNTKIQNKHVKVTVFCRREGYGLRSSVEVSSSSG